MTFELRAGFYTIMMEEMRNIIVKWGTKEKKVTRIKGDQNEGNQRKKEPENN